MSEKNDLRTRLAGITKSAEAGSKKTAGKKVAKKAKPRPAADAEPGTMPLRHPEHAAASGDVYTVRLNVLITPDMMRSLKVGSVDDGISISARIRGMIDLWAADGREAKAVNVRARKHNRQ